MREPANPQARQRSPLSSMKRRIPRRLTRFEKETGLKNQVWLITGSSRGLGRALAEGVLAAGHKLVATARNPKQLSPLVERYGDQVRAVALDVTDERAAAAAIQAAVDSFGRLDVLVNNAGYADLAGASTSIAPENPMYAATVGATARFQREYNGKQPGDPARAAAALMQIAGLEAPPLRLPLGSDAARAVEEAELARIASDKRWKELSISTDFPLNA